MLVDNLAMGILFVFFFIGYRKGVIAEFISFSALLFNIVLSKEITPSIIEKLEIVTSNKLKDILIYVVIFIATYIIFAAIIKILLRTVKEQKKFFIDSITGALLGFFKGIMVNILILLILLGVSKFDTNVDEKLKESKIFQLTNKFSGNVMLFIPEEIKDMIEKIDYQNEIEKAIQNSLGGRNNEKNR